MTNAMRGWVTSTVSDSSRLVARGLLLSMVWALAGCPPTCEQMCRKLDRCGLTANVERAECQLSCERELTVARDAEDNSLKATFNEHRLCIGNKSCDEIEVGVCYDADLFPFAL